MTEKVKKAIKVIKTDKELYRERIKPYEFHLAGKIIKGDYDKGEAFAGVEHNIVRPALKKHELQLSSSEIDEVTFEIRDAVSVNANSRAMRWAEGKPQYLEGGIVKETGYAKVHKGELIIPKKVVKSTVKTYKPVSVHCHYRGRSPVRSHSRRKPQRR